MSKNSIPPKNRPEWLKIDAGRLSELDAIEQIYNLCKKYKLVVKDDFTQIFKTW